jgi:CDP-diacylglycerol--serine O-phosphatidyltransferase
VAPALLINEAVLEPFPMPLSVPIAFAYVAAGAYRLARFNAMNADRDQHHYCGLTIPIAAMTTSSFWLFQRASGGALPGWFWIFLCVSLPVLMVSTIPYYWPRVGFRRGWRLGLQTVGVFAGVALMLVFPERSMFPLFATFILAGLLNKGLSAMRGEDAFWRRLLPAERREP